jgi:hypothetical protein
MFARVAHSSLIQTEVGSPRSAVPATAGGVSYPRQENAVTQTDGVPSEGEIALSYGGPKRRVEQCCVFGRAGPH